MNGNGNGNYPLCSKGTLSPLGLLPYVELPKSKSVLHGKGIADHSFSLFIFNSSPVYPQKSEHMLCDTWASRAPFLGLQARPLD